MFGHKRSRLNRKSILIPCCALILICVASAGAMAADTIEDDKGFYLGLKFTGSSLYLEDNGDAAFHVKDDGDGVVLDIGYRFNPTFMLEMSVGGADHKTSDPAVDARFEMIHILGYYRFSPQSAFRPYLKGGFSGNNLVIDVGSASWRVKGGGIALGGGFRYFICPHFSLGLDLTHSIIQYDNAEIAVEGFTYEWGIEEQGEATALGLQFGYSF